MTNPYEASSTRGTGDTLMSVSATHYLAQTRPWLYFIGVLMALGTLLLVLGGISMMFLGSLGTSEIGFMGPAIGLSYIVMAAIYGVPAYMLLAQATSIGGVTAGGGEDALAEVLRHHRNFWRFTGIATLLVMILYCGGIFVMVALMGSLASTFN